jgi:hypothetical protein
VIQPNRQRADQYRLFHPQSLRTANHAATVLIAVLATNPTAICLSDICNKSLLFGVSSHPASLPATSNNPISKIPEYNIGMLNMAA